MPGEKHTAVQWPRPGFNLEILFFWYANIELHPNLTQIIGAVHLFLAQRIDAGRKSEFACWVPQIATHLLIPSPTRLFQPSRERCEKRSSSPTPARPRSSPPDLQFYRSLRSSVRRENGEPRIWAFDFSSYSQLALWSMWFFFGFF